jgi:hypothetical protein
MHENHPELVILMIDVQENRQAAPTFSDDYDLTFPTCCAVPGSNLESFV